MDNAIETVLVDFDGTLVFHEPDSFDLVSSFCTDMGQPLSAEMERLGRRRRHEYFVDPAIRRKLENQSPGDFWFHFNRYLLQAIEIQGDLDQMAQALTARFVDLDWHHFCPQAGCDTLAELRQRGYSLGLITNRENVESLTDLLRRLELDSYFDLILASGEVGIHKPDPAIFSVALERLGARAERSIYVGDNYWADVLGAQQANITPVLLDPDRLFPEADCLVLDDIQELLAWLPGPGTPHSAIPQA